jgi:hypothetical protein
MNAGKTLFAQVMELARTWGRTGSLPRSKASGRRDSVNFLSVPKFPPQVPPEETAPPGTRDFLSLKDLSYFSSTNPVLLYSNGFRPSCVLVNRCGSSHGIVAGVSEERLGFR